MKKFVLFSVFLVTAAYSTEFKTSEFFQRTERPDLENVQEKFNAFKEALGQLELSEAQKASFLELQKSFETVVTPPKYLVSWSQGPAFREAALTKKKELIEEGDWHESMSYIHESWDEISSFCGAATYNDPDIDIEFDDVVRVVSDEPVFVWNSIKEAADQPSKAYILYTAIKLEVKEDPASRRWKKCLYPYDYNIVEKDLGADESPVLQESQDPSDLRRVFKGTP